MDNSENVERLSVTASSVSGEIIIVGSIRTDLERITNVLVKNVAASSQRIYQTDALQLARWLVERGVSVAEVNYEMMSEYRAHLAAKYASPTAARKLTVARRMLEVAVLLGIRPDNPAQQVKAFGGSSDNETPHRALTRNEAKELLAVIDPSTSKGKRDFALVMLLLRTGMRRAEAAALRLGDLKLEQGHNTAIIRQGKGNKRRKAKLPVDVMRAISQYLEAIGRKETEAEAPLFVRFAKSDKPKLTGLDGQDIERIVRGYALKAGLEGLSPHGLRASFVTLTLEGGAKLEQVQYAAGHADPRTTERYQKRKFNLDDNATDYLRL